MPLPGRDLASALAELQLAACPSQVDLRKQYIRLALRHHPDKVASRGGDARSATVKFHRIHEAYTCLIKNIPRGLPRAPIVVPPSQKPACVPTRSAAPRCSTPVSLDGARSRAARCGARLGKFRPGADRRKLMAKPLGTTPRSAPVVNTTFGCKLQLCVFCEGAGQPCINEATAANLGIAWVQYAGHPDVLRTCLWCKMEARSVVTEEQAIKKYPKLKTLPNILTYLRREGRSFWEGQTACYWTPDLERCAYIASGSQRKGVRRVSSTKLAEVSKNAALSRVNHSGAKRQVDEIGPAAYDERPTKSCKSNEHEASNTCLETSPLPKGTAWVGKERSDGCEWKYRVCGEKKLGIRQGPDINDTPSPKGHLRPGHTFIVCQRISGADGRMYLKLSNGDGWTYNRSAKDFNKIVAVEVSELPSDNPKNETPEKLASADRRQPTPMSNAPLCKQEQQ